MQKEILSLLDHGDRVRSAEFSRDGHDVLTSSWDRTVRLWDVDTGQALASIPNDDIILDAAFYQAAEDLIAAVKDLKPRELTGKDRRRYLSK